MHVVRAEERRPEAAEREVVLHAGAAVDPGHLGQALTGTKARLGYDVVEFGVVDRQRHVEPPGIERLRYQLDLCAVAGCVARIEYLRETALERYAQLHTFPFLAVHGAVDNQAAICDLCLRAELVVPERVRIGELLRAEPFCLLETRVRDQRVDDTAAETLRRLRVEGSGVARLEAHVRRRIELFHAAFLRRLRSRGTGREAANQKAVCGD